MKAIWKVTRKPLVSTYKRSPKADRPVVKPLFWLEPHFRGRHLRYVVVYVPGRFIVLGWSVRREVQRYV